MILSKRLRNSEKEIRGIGSSIFDSPQARGCSRQLSNRSRSNGGGVARRWCGGVAAVLLSTAVAAHWTGLVAEWTESNRHSVFLVSALTRIGMLFAALWLAWIHVRRPAVWFAPRLAVLGVGSGRRRDGSTETDHLRSCVVGISHGTPRRPTRFPRKVKGVTLTGPPIGVGGCCWRFVLRLAIGVWRLAFGDWRWRLALAFGDWRLAVGVGGLAVWRCGWRWRLRLAVGVCVWRLRFGVWRFGELALRLRLAIGDWDWRLGDWRLASL